MTEWVLLVWLLVPGGSIADPVEVGAYRVEGDCERSRDSFESESGVTFIARCVERDK